MLIPILGPIAPIRSIRRLFSMLPMQEPTHIRESKPIRSNHRKTIGRSGKCPTPRKVRYPGVSVVGHHPISVSSIGMEIAPHSRNPDISVTIVSNPSTMRTKNIVENLNVYSTAVIVVIIISVIIVIIVVITVIPVVNALRINSARAMQEVNNVAMKAIKMAFINVFISVSINE